MTSDDDTRLRFASEWFYFHAEQRLRSYNFFLITFAGLAAAAGQVSPHHLRAFGVALGGIGTVAACSFFALELRNHALVDSGRTQLLIIEQDLGLAIVAPTRQHRALHHKYWIRAFMSITGLAFAGFAVWAWFGFAGA